MNDAPNADRETTSLTREDVSDLENASVAAVHSAVRCFLQVTAARAMAESPEMYADVDVRIRAGHAFVRVQMDLAGGGYELSAKAVDLETGEEFANVGSVQVQQAALNG